jgi:aryl-alcohol dehydrogenase-like predicted oxidoreductase
MEHLPGRATADGTRAFRERALERRRISPLHFRESDGGLALTSIGLGTYLGPPDPATDIAVAEAVSIALSSGRVNVIDTAINYRGQRAERSVGRALTRLAASGAVRREEVFVATKIGYLAPDGESERDPRSWVHEELVQPGILPLAEVVGGSHSMAPSFLRDQFHRSRTNLQVAALDLLYLHNAPDAQIPEVGRKEFERRLGLAFEVLEGFRAEGTLGAYGLATWDALRTVPEDPGFVPLESAVRIARGAGGGHHGFRFIQFPFNLAMPEAATLANQPVDGVSRTLFAAARALGIGCFTSVPLLQGRLARSGSTRGGLKRAPTALQFARSAPGNTAALVGLKRPEHIAENLELASIPPWDETTFSGLLPAGSRSGSTSR